MNKLITLTRDGKTIKVLERQMAHDVQLSPGKKFKHGSGKMWTVTNVEEAPEYNSAPAPVCTFERDEDAMRMHDQRILHAVAYSHIYQQWNKDRTGIERVRVLPCSAQTLELAQQGLRQTGWFGIVPVTRWS